MRLVTTELVTVHASVVFSDMVSSDEKMLVTFLYYEEETSRLQWP